jgi:hypothetical protein
MSLFSIKSLGLAVLAAAVTFTVSPVAALAQSSDVSVVRTVPAVNAPTLITGMVAVAKRGPATPKGHTGNAVEAIQPLVPEAATAKDLGPAAADMKMGLQLVLRRSAEQQQALDMLVQRTQNPKDELFGSTLTPKEFAQTFGLAHSDLHVLTGWLKSQGFTLLSVDNGRLAITFKGTAAQVESAFGAQMHNYKGADGQEHFAPATEWTVPSQLRPAVAGLKGLQNFTAFEAKNFDGPVADFHDNGEAVPANGESGPPALHLNGNIPADASFTASHWTMAANGSTDLNVRIVGDANAVHGSLQITDDQGHNIAFVKNITSCESSNGGFGRSCTISYTPGSEGTRKLVAVYGGDDFTRATTLTIIANNTGGTATVTTVTSSPISFNFNSFGGATAGGTVTAVLAWAEVGTAPTGNLAVTETTSSHSLGTASVATAGAQACTAFSGTCSVTCTPNVASMNTSCVFTLSAIFTILPNIPATGSGGGGSGENTIQAAYAGDSNYLTSTGTTAAFKEQSRNGSNEVGPYFVASITSASALAAGTYGLTAAEAPTVSVAANPTVNTFDVFGNSLNSFLEAVGSGNLGSMGFVTPATATCATACAVTMSFTVPALVTPSATPYTVTYDYSGNLANATAAGSYFGVYSPSNSATFNLTINKQLPTFSNTTASPVSAGVGTSTPITISSQLNWLGIGATPTGAVTLTVTGPSSVTGSPFTATCGTVTTAGSGNAETNNSTCSATIPGATIMGLTGGTYTITPANAADTNYGVATTVPTGTFKILPATTATMTSPTSVSPKTEVYEALSAFTVTGQIAYTSGTVPLTSAVSFTSTAAGTFGAVTCTGASSPISCSATFTPTATDLGGSYNINIVFAGDTNNAGSSSSVTGNFIISPASFTTELMTNSAYGTPPTATTEQYGAMTPFSVYATLSPATAVPTGADVVFTTSTAGIGSFSTPTCTVVTSVARCTSTFTPNGTATPGSYNINVSFSGDNDYGASGSSGNGTGLYVVTNASPTLTFNPSPIASTVGSTTPITVTVTASNGDTGTVNFTGTYATYGTLSATSCVITVTSCSVTFTPNGTTAIGTYTNILTADLPANGFYSDATANDSLTIAGYTTYLAVSPTTTGTTTNGTIFTARTAADSLTVVLSWTSPSSQPTGIINLLEGTSNAELGSITLPAAGLTTSAGTSSMQPATGSALYSCTETAGGYIMTCMLTNTSMTSNFTDTAAGSGDTQTGNGNTTITASYAGAGNYAAATAASAYVFYNGFSTNAPDTPTYTTPTALTTQTYGMTTTDSVSFTIASVSDTALFNSAGQFISAIGTLTSSGADSQLGTLYYTPDTAGTSCFSCAITASLVIPPIVTPGAYTVTYIYPGDYQYEVGEDNAAKTTETLTVTKQTPTFGTMTFAPAASEPYGTNQAITISDKLTYLGVGVAPLGAVNFVLNAVTYPATCVASGTSGSGNTQSNVETCSATVAGTVIDVLAVAAYTVTATYVTDTNYLGATGASGTFTITAGTTTTAVTSVVPASVVFGSGTPSTVTATVAYSGGGAAPTGMMTFSSTAPGVFSGQSCGVPSGDVITCTATFTPSVGDAVGTYTISATYSANGNYGGSSSTQTNNYSITAVTPTVSLTPVSAPFGSVAPVAITVTATGDNGATATFGDTSGGGSFSSTTCVIASNTCSVNYIPSGSLAAGTYAGDLTVSVGAFGNYGTGNATSTLTITKIAPTVSLTPVSAPFGSTTPVAITVTATGDNGATATFGDTSGGGSFSPATCVIASNTCSVNYIPSGVLAAGTYTNDLTVSVAAFGSYTAGSAMSTLTITKIAPTNLLTSIMAPYGSTAPVMITASSNANGSVVTFGTAGGVGGSYSPATCTIASGSCTVNYIPSGTLPVGTYTNDLTASFAATTNYTAGSATSTLTITTATETLVLSAITPGTPTLSPVGGTTSTTLTATASPSVPDGTTVVFTDMTTGAFVTTSTTSNTASITVTTSTAGVSAGLNVMVASIGPSANTSTANSNTLNIYLQGILLSASGNHNFSNDPGTVDGSPVCNGSNGTAGITCVNPFGITVINFTTSVQALSSVLSMPSTMNNAFSENANCNQTLSAGSQCSVTYGYEPPYGDGTCTYTGGGSCTGQGAFEDEKWTIADSTTPGILFGIGNQGFTRGGLVYQGTPGGLLEGKALLAQGSLTVAPLNHNFGSVAAGATSGTETITVTNSGASPVSFTYAGPTTSAFTANNNCTSPLGANSTCSIFVTLESSTAGSYSDSISITPMGGSAIVSSFSGMVLASGAGLTVNASSHNFGNVSEGSMVTFGLSVTNNTAVSQSVTVMYPSATGYTIANGCSGSPYSLAAGAHCVIAVTFAPTSSGQANISITISSGVPITPGGTGSGMSYSDVIAFTGNGVAGGNFTATSITHNFGTLAVGTSGGNYGVELSNNTGAAITLTTGPLSSTTEGFTVVGTSCGTTLNNNANCELLFSFTPNATGFVSATYPVTGSVPLYFAGSPAPTPNQITLRGTGQ